MYYQEKFENIQEHTLFRFLNNSNRESILSTAEELKFTAQELRQVSEMVKDIEMWEEGDFETILGRYYRKVS